MPFSIRKLGEDDWQLNKEIRLKALSSDPHVFGSTWEIESELPDSEWRERLAKPNVAIFVLFEDETPIGITGVSLDRDDPTGRTALLWGSWLEPRARGQGLSTMFYESRIEWAREHTTVERVIVSHRASNLASKYANQNFNFVPKKVTEKLWSDGIIEQECHYELIL